MTSAVVRLERLAVTFGRRPVLQDLSLSLNAGEIFCLLGPDGAGKTTLLRVLAGLERRYTGTVRVLGRPPSHPELKHRRVFLPQEFSLYRDLTVAENLRFFAGLYGTSPEAPAVQRALRMSGLAPFLHRAAGKLSGGMQKKLALMTALLIRPDLLILDEPTTGVDPVSRRELWDLLFDLHQQGTTLLFTTPYTEEAERSHRVGILLQGRLAVVAPPEHLLQNLEGRVFLAPPGAPLPRRPVATLLQGSWRRVIFAEPLPEVPPDLKPAPPTLEDALAVAGRR